MGSGVNEHVQVLGVLALELVRSHSELTGVLLRVVFPDRLHLAET